MPKILVVDDSPLDQRTVGVLLKNIADADIRYATTGAEAMDAIDNDAPDLVVTDLVMPEMNGLELLARVGVQHPLVPVVLMTAEGSEEVAARAVQSGALGYVPKLQLAKFLPAIVERLLRLAQDRKEQHRLIHSITRSESEIVIHDNDASLITPLIEYASGCLRNSCIVEPGSEDLICLALEEALRNAIHHGNLELDSSLREDDNEEKFQRAIAERRKISPYKDRKVFVGMTVSKDGARFEVRDEGPGFDPALLPDPTSPERLDSVCGRGILLMKSLMDEVIYSEKGNHVVLVKLPRRENLEQDSACDVPATESE